MNRTQSLVQDSLPPGLFILELEAGARVETGSINVASGADLLALLVARKPADADRTDSPGPEGFAEHRGVPVL